MSEKSPVYFFDGDDPAMQQAFESARETFGHFWRELTWEYRRIIPALDLAIVKYPFWDEDPTSDEAPAAEQMWLSDIAFDGKEITGTLGNSPNWVQSVKQGDEVKVPKDGISDWMYAINGKAYGAYTVNLMRQRMPAEERAGHDDAWGLDFGDPNRADFATNPNAEHPMSINMAESLTEFLKQDPNNAHSADENGWTMLHSLALGGSESCVRILLEHGANRSAVTNHGMTPLQLAESLNWENVAALLR